MEGDWGEKGGRVVSFRTGEWEVRIKIPVSSLTPSQTGTPLKVTTMVPRSMVVLHPAESRIGREMVFVLVSGLKTTFFRDKGP